VSAAMREVRLFIATSVRPLDPCVGRDEITTHYRFLPTVEAYAVIPGRCAAPNPESSLLRKRIWIPGSGLRPAPE
jgi:hypothetical protein